MNLASSEIWAKDDKTNLTFAIAANMVRSRIRSKTCEIDEAMKRGTTIVHNIPAINAVLVGVVVVVCVVEDVAP